MGLVGVALVVLGGWLALIGVGVLTNRSDSPVGFFGLVVLLAGGCMLLAAKVGVVRMQRLLGLSKFQAGACALIAYTGGTAGALAFWTGCSSPLEGSGDARPVLMVGLAAALAAAALAAFWAARPWQLMVGLLAGVAVVAIATFWWLTGNTVSPGCPWYERLPSTPRPEPAPTTTTAAPGS